ncbi:MAG: hypothetical protein Q7S33_01795 [Nanoarchaeota archaeon]|nr:hypothetical protein [Nanoarchaeota archaeon]
MEKKKRIVFYVTFGGGPPIFVYKLAKEFRRKGYETVLFTICEKNKLDWKFYREAFDKIICSDFEFRKPNLKTIPYVLKKGPSLLRFLFLSKFTKPYAVIGVVGGHWLIKCVHKLFYKKYPFIFHTFDIRSQAYFSMQQALSLMPKFETEAEKYIYEVGDGIIYKGAPDELKYLEGRIFDKINFSELQLNFLPYCSKDFFVPLNKNKLSKKDKELHMVYVGSLVVEMAKETSEFFNKILNQKIHLHVYTIDIASHLSKEKEKEYIKNIFSSCINNPYFHLHETLSPKELIPEISKYDFGLFPWIKSDSDLSKNNIMARFCMSNKTASYLEAGIPVVFDTEYTYLNKLMKSYGLDLSYNDKSILTLNKRLKSLSYPLLEKKVEKTREDYSVEKNFDRLEDFIKKVVAKKKSK